VSTTIDKSVKRDWILRLHHDRQDPVMVHGKGGDCFPIPMEAAVRACQMHEDIQKVVRQYQQLAARLAEWAVEHRADISEVYLALRPGGQLFLVNRRSKAYNAEMEDALSALELEIGHNDDFDKMNLEALSLPAASAEGIDGFLAGALSLHSLNLDQHADSRSASGHRPEKPAAH
jgi:hypothetical protein